MIFLKTNKTDITLGRPTKETREEAKKTFYKWKMKHTQYYRNKRLIRNCYQLYTGTLENIEYMDNFVETLNLSRLNKEETEDMNR